VPINGPKSNRLRSSLAIGLVASLTLAACGNSSDSESANDALVLTADITAVAAFVAQDEGMFRDAGVDVEVSTVGFDQAASLLIAGNSDLAWMNPLEVAQLASEGEDFRYLSTAGALNMYNGVVVRAADGDKYNDISDLAGARVGQPGFGTGTWTNFEVFANKYYGITDPQGTFDLVTADSGALMAMLETGEIDAALMFAADSASARFSDKFKTVFSFTEVMQENDGQPLAITGPVATGDWLEAHPDEATSVIEGLDAAVVWMAQNTDQFRAGGKYEELAEENGWLRDPAATDGILGYIAEMQWFLTSDSFTEEWRQAIQGLVVDGEGVLVESDNVPTVDAYLAPAS
jgi:ABC-type nitrate/sulfonate/bicarbonate transport system substrate-binding protein